MSDLFSPNTALLLPMQGANNATDFLDRSQFPKSVVSYGSTCLSSAVKKYGETSAYFDGSNSGLTFNSIPGFATGVSNFTIECWLYISEIPNPSSGYYTSAVVFQDNPYNRCFDLQLTGTSVAVTGITFTAFSNDIGGEAGVSCNYSFSLNTWYYISVTRLGNKLYLFVDGALLNPGGSTLTISIQQFTIAKLCIGFTEWSDYRYRLRGYIQDLRLTPGIARYVDSFAPPDGLLPIPSPIGVIIHDQAPPVLDIVDGGHYRIADNVSRLGVIGRYRVRLFDRRTARVIRETWSGSNGFYAFNNIAYRAAGYFVVAFDHSNTPVNAAIGDYITPEPMPS